MADSFLSGPSGRYGRSAIHRFRRLSRVCIMCTRRTGTRISCPFSIPPNRILGLERFIRLTPFRQRPDCRCKSRDAGANVPLYGAGPRCRTGALDDRAATLFPQQRLTLKPGQARAQANHSDLLLGAAWNPNGALSAETTLQFNTDSKHSIRSNMALS